MITKNRLKNYIQLNIGFICLLLFLATRYSLIGESGAPTLITNPVPTKIKLLLVTGIDEHNWKQTTPIIASHLISDPRLEVRIIEDPYLLDSSAITNYQVIFLHFQNGSQPAPGPKAQTNLANFVKKGGGLVVVHFAVGAWINEWPEYRQILGKTWFGPKPPPGRRQHDPYGAFTVNIVNQTHPITRGLNDFETMDELYTCLEGTDSIDILATAKSRVDGLNYPIAFTHTYGQGRIFVCVLGHDIKSVKNEGFATLITRGAIWASENCK